MISIEVRKINVVHVSVVIEISIVFEIIEIC